MGFRSLSLLRSFRSIVTFVAAVMAVKGPWNVGFCDRV